jgi:hypothetical protein
MALNEADDIAVCSFECRDQPATTDIMLSAQT